MKFRASYHGWDYENVLTLTFLFEYYFRRAACIHWLSLASVTSVNITMNILCKKLHVNYTVQMKTSMKTSSLKKSVNLKLCK
jgi:hypothetical protein